MSREFELATISSVGGWLRIRKKRVNIKEGDPCPNCVSILQGPFCHNCGQFAEDMHRSFFRLCFEFIEGVLHIDGRVWQTLARLVATPGRLTSDYLKGKRAPQIPPFRMFLVMLFLAFAVGQFVRGRAEEIQGQDPLGFLSNIEVDNQAVKERLEKNQKAKELLSAIGKDAGEVSSDIKEALTSAKKDLSFSEKADAASAWLSKRAKAIKEDPKRFFLILEIWAHRVAILALPLVAFLISLLFIFQRRFYIYDHLVFSTHLLTFHLILLSFILASSLVVGSFAWQFALASPVHVWFHMRKVYGSSIFGTLFRMFFLGLGTAIGFSGLLIAWLLIGANAMV